MCGKGNKISSIREMGVGVASARRKWHYIVLRNMNVYENKLLESFGIIKYHKVRREEKVLRFFFGELKQVTRIKNFAISQFLRFASKSIFEKNFLSHFLQSYYMSHYICNNGFFSFSILLIPPDVVCSSVSISLGCPERQF